MFCSRSVPIHLLRGLGAVLLLIAAFIVGREQVWLVPPLLVGAVILLRGCPACWLVGLLETAATRRAAKQVSGRDNYDQANA